MTSPMFVLRDGSWGAWLGFERESVRTSHRVLEDTKELAHHRWASLGARLVCRGFLGRAGTLRLVEERGDLRPGGQLQFAQDIRHVEARGGL